jgi:peptide/nickel transport system substrate-binding protein
MSEGKFETDPARREELSLEAQQIMVDEASRVYLWAKDWIIATRSDITGIKKDFSSVPRLEALGRGDFTNPTATTPVAAAPAECTSQPLRVSDESDTDILELHLFRSTGAYTTTRALSWPPLDQTYVENDGILEGTWETVPSALIESVEWSDDRSSATFVVHGDAKFADGKPITAHDFVYTFKRAIDSAGSYIPLLLPFVDIDSSDLIEVVDDRTFTVNANRPTALLERFLTFQVFAPIDKELAEANSTEEDPWAFDYFVDHNNSSGPYTLTNWDRATGELVLDLNPGFPGEVNNCGVIIKNIPDAEQRVQLLQNGELDVIMGVPPRLLSTLEDDPNVTVYRAPSSSVNYLYMNRAFAPLDNKLVRQAISWAVPYDAILSNVLYGYAQPAGTLVTSPMETYQGDAAGVYSFDLDKAREAFEASGVEPFSIELGVQQSQTQDQQAAVLIQDNLRQIGIDLEINILPDGDFQSRRNNREMPMSFHDWYSWGDDPFYQMTFLGGCGSFVNFADGCNERLDEIMSEGKFETDPARREELSLEAQQIMVDEASRVYLWAKDWIIATRSDVTGIKKDFSSVPRLEALGRNG